MRRKLLNLATGLLLLLLCAVTLVWVRSYWTADLAGFTRQTPTPHSHVIWSANGNITYRHLASPPGSKAVYQSPGWVFGHFPPSEADNTEFGPNVHRFLGVWFSDNTWKGSPRSPMDGERQVLVRVSYWLLWIAAGALPIVRLVSRWHRRGAARLVGRCPICGYDLRATPDRCPECGTVPPARPEPTAAASPATAADRR